jgi:hypothetical protein
MKPYDFRELIISVISEGKRRGGYFKHSGFTITGAYHGYYVSIITGCNRDTASPATIEKVTRIQAAGGYAIFARDLYDAVELFDMIDQREALRRGEQVIPF